VENTWKKHIIFKNVNRSNTSQSPQSPSVCAVLPML
jgi:hypothetical protein